MTPLKKANGRKKMQHKSSNQCSTAPNMQKYVSKKMHSERDDNFFFKETISDFNGRLDKV